MSRKFGIKILIDVLMTLVLLFLMGYQFWGQMLHEWAGSAMLVLFLLHHFLNKGWYRGLVTGKKSFWLRAQTWVDILLLLVMLTMMVSGILMSHHVFSFVDIPGTTGWARLAHMASVHWGFVLMAVHLGLHWDMVLGMVGKKRTAPMSHGGKIRLCLLGTVVAVYGLAAFIQRGLIDYMFLRIQFAFLDFGESKVLFYVQYLAIMGTFIYLAHYAKKLAKRKEQ